MSCFNKIKKIAACSKNKQRFIITFSVKLYDLHCNLYSVLIKKKRINLLIIIVY